jgi:hypothetical protein
MGNINDEGQIRVRGSFFRKVAEEVLVVKCFITFTKI